jgi:hypothetical protein
MAADTGLELVGASTTADVERTAGGPPRIVGQGHKRGNPRIASTTVEAFWP